MMQYFRNRRTVRDYTDREITDELLHSILEDAMRAPTCGNMQLYSVVVTRDADMRRKLSPAHFGQPMVEHSAAVLTICADLHRFSRWCILSNATPGFDNFQSFISAMVDAVAYAQQIVTIAEMHGLGSCYLGTVTWNAPQISEVLELPDMVVPVACVTLGWPAGTSEQCERLPLQAVMHTEKYNEVSDKELIRLYKAKDEFPANQQFIEENGKQTLAQVFTEVRYPGDANRHFSEVFTNFLRQKHLL